MSEHNDGEELSGLALQFSRMLADFERRQTHLIAELSVSRKNFEQATEQIKHLVARIAFLEARLGKADDVIASVDAAVQNCKCGWHTAAALKAVREWVERSTAEAPPSPGSVPAA